MEAVNESKQQCQESCTGKDDKIRKEKPGKQIIQYESAFDE